MREGLPSEREGYSGKVLVFPDLCLFFYDIAIKYPVM